MSFNLHALSVWKKVKQKLEGKDFLEGREETVQEQVSGLLFIPMIVTTLLHECCNSMSAPLFISKTSNRCSCLYYTNYTYTILLTLLKTVAV